MENAKLKSPALLIGPAYSGKSDFANQLLNHHQSALVIGTGSPEDDTLKQRIIDLRQMRPTGWTVHEGCDHLVEKVAEGLKNYDQILIDAVNQWLSHTLLDLLLRHDLQQVEQAMLHEGEKLANLIKQADSETKKIVIVSSENAAGITPPLAVARSFRRLVSLINQQLAAHCQTVISFTAGIPTVLRGAG